MAHMERFFQEIEAPPDQRVFGKGWISGVVGLVLALIGLGVVLCLSYPDLLTLRGTRHLYNIALIRFALQAILLLGFLLGILSLLLRSRKMLGFSTLGLILIATAIGSTTSQSHSSINSDVYLGLDYFLISLIFTGTLFIPLERLFGIREGGIFRFEWKEDLLYLLISSIFVQALTYVSLIPSHTILHIIDLKDLRGWVGSQHFIMQVLEITIFTDIVHYWVHRTFHRIPWLWKFHAVHHSAQVMDWLAGARMHFVEIVCIRSLTVIPMYVLGFTVPAMQTYLIVVYVHTTFIHANLRGNLGLLQYLIVTPRYHHWHHGIEKEAIDVNFAIHFPFLDWLFGTFFLPGDSRWPVAYGIDKHPVPKGYVSQFLYPFGKQKPAAASLGQRAKIASDPQIAIDD